MIKYKQNISGFGLLRKFININTDILSRNDKSCFNQLTYISVP